MTSIHQNLQISTGHLLQKRPVPSYTAVHQPQATYQSKLFAGTDQIHFGHAERPRVQRGQENSDSKVKDRLNQELLNNQIEWQKALDSKIDPSIELALQYRLARNQAKDDSEAREVVYIGRNSLVDEATHQSMVTQSVDKPELLKFMSPEQVSSLINNRRIINDIAIDSSATTSPISRQHGNIAIEGDQYKYTDEHSLLGTKVVIKLPRNWGPRTIHSNTAFVLPDKSFLTLLSRNNISEEHQKVEPKNEEILDTGIPAHANSIFSKMAHSLKSDEVLYIVKTSEQVPSSHEIKVVKQSVTKAPPEGRVYRIMRTLNDDSFRVQSLDFNGQVIQFLNPIVKQPADVLVKQADWIAFPSMEGSKDVRITIPKPFHWLNLESILEKMGRDRRILNTEQTTMVRR